MENHVCLTGSQDSCACYSKEHLLHGKSLPTYTRNSRYHWNNSLKFSITQNYHFSSLSAFNKTSASHQIPVEGFIFWIFPQWNIHIIYGTDEPTIPNLWYTVQKISDIETDRQIQYVNHFCLLVQIIFWLPLVKLGAVTIWFPCVYFSLGSV